MRAFIVTTFIGCFGIREDKKILSFKPFPKDVGKVVEKLMVSESSLIEEEKEICSELEQKGYEVIKAEVGSETEKFVKENLRNLSLQYNFFKNQAEFNQFFSKVITEITKEKMKKSIKKDNFAIQIVKIIEDIDKTVNVLMERLRELYSLHFPEMDKLVPDHKKFAKIVEKYGKREKIEDPNLKQIAKESMGVEFGKEEIEIAQSLANRILLLYEFRENLTCQLEKILKEVAPNFTELAGTMLSAKLIARAGGLEKLAKMPSSAIQLIGAEKSLFRFLHGKGKSPRFGIIYNHPLILNAPEKMKGKIARALASKLSIAAKLDFYSKEYMGEKLKKELEEKVKKIISTNQRG